MNFAQNKPAAQATNSAQQNANMVASPNSAPSAVKLLTELNYAGINFPMNFISNRNLNDWILDSGASDHIIYDKRLLLIMLQH